MSPAHSCHHCLFRPRRRHRHHLRHDRYHDSPGPRRGDAPSATFHPKENHERGDRGGVEKKYECGLRGGFTV